jgi:hypothetical protein
LNNQDLKRSERDMQDQPTRGRARDSPDQDELKDASRNRAYAALPNASGQRDSPAPHRNGDRLYRYIVA